MKVINLDKEDKFIVIITGPTACGKTKVAIELAKNINGEIISADSMQVYKFMDIGTAKIKESEMEGIKHYLIDEFYPEQEFSIAVFQKYTKIYIQEIWSKNKIPIIVGGTGFYINSIIFDNDFEKVNKEKSYRAKLQDIANTRGNIYLHSMLKEVDYQSYEKIHSNNVKKVIRALEFYKQTGKKISEHNEEQKNKKEAYKNYFFILNMPRDELYKRINKRVDIMIGEGLLEEVKMLLRKGYNKNLQSMQAIGYKELIKYIENEISFENAVELIKKNTRNFAKRQLTWFKNKCSGKFIDIQNYESYVDIANDIKNNIYNKSKETF